MTANQISYARLGEESRHNRAVETETNRTNLVREGNERASIQETARSNRAREKETNRSNLAKEAETKRSNLANEAMKRDDLNSQFIQREYQNIKTAAESSKIRGDELTGDLNRALLQKQVNSYDALTATKIVTDSANAAANLMKGAGSIVDGIIPF